MVNRRRFKAEIEFGGEGGMASSCVVCVQKVFWRVLQVAGIDSRS